MLASVHLSPPHYIAFHLFHSILFNRDEARDKGVLLSDPSSPVLESGAVVTPVETLPRPSPAQQSSGTETDSLVPDEVVEAYKQIHSVRRTDWSLLSAKTLMIFYR